MKGALLDGRGLCAPPSDHDPTTYQLTAHPHHPCCSASNARMRARRPGRPSVAIMVIYRSAEGPLRHGNRTYRAKLALLSGVATVVRYSGVISAFCQSSSRHYWRVRDAPLTLQEGILS